MVMMVMMMVTVVMLKMGMMMKLLLMFQLNEIIRAPVEGDFWQVDHIQPVYSGGGQCSLDNLQTLCTVCHRMVTNAQTQKHKHTQVHTAALLQRRVFL